jgi:hypothetical protein
MWRKANVICFKQKIRFVWNFIGAQNQQKVTNFKEAGHLRLYGKQQ